MNFLLMGGYGLYVWSAFLFTFILCFVFFLRTKKTLKKLEKDFIQETQSFSEQQIKDLKKQRIAKEILVSHSRT